MFCTKCGTECSNEEKFCHQCGTVLHPEVAAALENSSQIQSQVQARQSGTTYVVLGWVFFAMSLLFVPVLFGAGTVIMGYLVRKNRNITHGTVMMILGVAGAILGTLLGAAIASLM
ncbi:MAG TPA: zinc-ribbon domain-containing protein [Neobacillus sp.]